MGRRLRILLPLALAALARAGTPSPQPGAGAQAWACGGAGAGSQAWALLPAGAPPSPLALLALRDGRVLGVPGASNDTVQLGVEGRASPPPAAQLWALGSDGLLRSALNGRCAGVSDAALGARVYLLPCNASDVRQGWAWAGGGGAPAPGEFGSLQQGASGASGGCLDVGGALTCASPSLAGALYCNASAPAEARAADLAGRLQMPDLRLLLGGWYESQGVPRLGLARFSFAEALHGLGSAGCGHPFSNASYTTSGCATSFPHATLLAAAFDRSLWAAVGGAISAEARGARGGLLLWTPDINLSRAQTWGRAQEVPGECPLLTGEYAAAFVAGLQAAAPGLPLRAVATCKHWHSYDFEGGLPGSNLTRHTFDANVTRKDLVEYYTAPFRACVQRGGAASVMSSINAVNGVPSAASTNFTVRLLQQQWGARAFVTSDCGTVADLVHTHHYAASGPAAVAAALRGGTDYNCGNARPPPGVTGAGYFNAYLDDALAQGLVELAEVRAAAARLLTAVVRLGLLDGNAGAGGPYAHWGAERLDTPAHRALSLRGAQAGIVLLRNDARALPLALRGMRRLALLGPHANASAALLANYAGENTLAAAHTPLLRIGARAAAAGVAVDFSPGLPSAHSNDTSGVPAAAAAARGADATLLFLGLDQTLEREGLDRADLALPGAQRALLAAVSAAVAAGGGTLVVVLVGGGAIAEPAPGAHALVAAFYPGQLGGEALAALLAGEAAFSGRLPVTFYAANYSARRAPTDMRLAPHGSAPGATYWHADPAADVLFPFGAGLSTGGGFSLAWAGAGNVSIDAGAWARGEAGAPAWRVRVARAPPPSALPAADVSVLGFFVPGAGQGEARVKLFDFARASGAAGVGAAGLAPGQAAELALALPAEVAGRVDAAGTRTLLPGLYSVRIGGDAGLGPGSASDVGAPLLGWLQVTGEATVLDALPF